MRVFQCREGNIENKVTEIIYKMSEEEENVNTNDTNDNSVSGYQFSHIPIRRGKNESVH